MNLPNFKECVEIKQLFIQMGIVEMPELAHVNLLYEVVRSKQVEIPNPTIRFSEEMQIGSVLLSDSGVIISIADDSTIEVNGVKACAYIKKQSHGVNVYNRTSTYKYHLCNCQTIQRMFFEGRKDRYVSTSRSDEWFPIIYQYEHGAKEMSVKMELCQHCISILRSKGMFPNPYSLHSFFKKYQPDIPKTIRRSEQVLSSEKYAPNHPEVAKRYKEQVEYRCQLCGVRCIPNKECLHLHHIDGDGQNNIKSNLRVLCTDCHSKQPNHSRMLGEYKFREQIRTIKQMRNAQGIQTLA